MVKPDQDQNAVKDVPSTDGMKLSMQNSELLASRIAADLPGKHIAEMKQALSEKDFHKFAEITMRESN